MNSKVAVGHVCWAVKFHLDSAEPMPNEKAWIDNHVVYRIEGKERPAIVLRESSVSRGGRKWFIAVYLTTKHTDGHKVRTDVIDCGQICGDQVSYAERSLQDVPENLFRRAQAKIPVLFLQSLTKQLAISAYKNTFSE